MVSQTSWAARILIGLVRLYQYVLSPWVGHQCRFDPRCSDYALTAIATHGAVRGAWLIVKRLGRCQPFYKGSWIDPVPPRR